MEDLNKGNSYFVDEQFTEALECYNKACQQMPDSYESFFKRSQVHHKLESLSEALEDINTCIRIDANNSKSYLKKGQLCFEMEEYDTALKAFEKGASIDTESAQFKTWIRKTKAELGQTTTATPAPVAAAPVAAAATPAPAPVTAATPATPSLPIPSSGGKVRHEWYQTSTHVTLTIFAKFVTANNSKIDIKDKSINISFAMATGSEFVFDIDFFDPVAPEESNTKYYSTKVEVILKKSRGVRWDNLEFTGTDTPVGEMDTPVAATKSVVSPYSSKKDWNKLEESAEDKEGDPLNRVFQDIFQRGSDEQQRAMMKSYVESGGTVLSTNWDDVKKGEVKGSAPKGMEMHSWKDGAKVEEKKKSKGKVWEEDD
eukprot:gene16137-19200_t